MTPVVSVEAATVKSEAEPATVVFTTSAAPKPGAVAISTT
jgi:hypothetical protein